MADTDVNIPSQEPNGKIISLPDKLVLRCRTLCIIMIERIGSRPDEWRVSRGDACYVTAKVSDTDFLLKMEEGAEEVARGEYLAVDLETTQTLSIDGKLTIAYDIKKVIQHSLFSKSAEKPKA